MEDELRQYMVEFRLPETMHERFTAQIPAQRACVNQYFMQGKLLSYALSLEKSRLWAVFVSDNEAEVVQWVEAMPLTRYMRYKVHVLTFFNSFAPDTPHFSLN
jgi:muconolactone delta-isomerase